MISLFSCYQTLFHIIYLLQLLSLWLCFSQNLFWASMCCSLRLALTRHDREGTRGFFKSVPRNISPFTPRYFLYIFFLFGWFYGFTCFICFLFIFHTFFPGWVERVLPRINQIFRRFTVAQLLITLSALHFIDNLMLCFVCKLKYTKIVSSFKAH